MPVPSLPIIKTDFEGKSIVRQFCPPASAPKTQKPACLSCSAARTRLFTIATGTQALAPALVRPITSLPAMSLAELCSGITTREAPNWSQLRRMAPTL